MEILCRHFNSFEWILTRISAFWPSKSIPQIELSSLAFVPMLLSGWIKNFDVEEEEEWKKRSERRKHCALAAVRRSQKFSSRRRPPLIVWRWSLPSPTNPVWWRSMHAISSYRSNRPTNTHTQTNPQTGRLQYTAPLSLARSVDIWTLGIH